MLVPSMMNVSVSFDRRRDQERSRRVRPADGRPTVRQRVVERHRRDAGSTAVTWQISSNWYGGSAG